ncbi:GDSL-type esterase/lipase family protein [Rhodoplanes azumiensis]|uniref:GDSL-type esterase/lipase family protein n=1 Tax=Rhodoplanes azumiensis TaxID=1897628 RepID=A0ABW5AI92_9BRAD
MTQRRPTEWFPAQGSPAQGLPARTAPIRRLLGALVAVALVIVAQASVAVLSGALVPGVATPARAQLFDDRFPFQNPFGNPFQRQRQREQQQYWNPFAPPQEQRQAAPPPDFSKAPPPKKHEGTPTTNVVVLGDSMADWLAYGLETAFAESPEMGVVRKHRTQSGLIRQDVRSDPRGEHPDWPKALQDVLGTDKPDFIVMMIGVNDRRPIREPRAARAAVGRAGQQGQQAQPGQPGQPGQPAQPGQQATPGQPAPPADDAAGGDAQQAGGGALHEFRSERWSELYIRRIDETIAALKSKGVPVFWVGLPPVRGTRSMADFGYLNDLYRSRAEKAGIVYIDVWDGFVDEQGRFAQQGPDVEGQIRRLRAGDGVHFTQAGARKLAHYVERELQRWMTARGTVALPVDEPAKEPELPAAAPEVPGAPSRPAGTARPLAGPVITLSMVPIAAEGDDQLVGAPRQTKTAALDVVAAKVLQKGEAMPSPAGRADDFAWPRREPAAVGADPVVAYTTLPMTPMKGEKQMVADAPAAVAPATAAAPKPPGQSAPRVARAPQPQYQQQQSFFGGGGWFGQPYRQPQGQQYRQVQRPTFFPFLFGGGR